MRFNLVPRFGFCLLMLSVFALPALAADGIRLDSRVKPTAEAITLNLDATAAEFSGSVVIDITVSEATGTFEFHAQEMTFSRIELFAGDTAHAVTTTEGDEGLITATVAKELAPGNYRLEIDFNRAFDTHAEGLYRVDQADQGYLFTQFESVYARMAFPCWDEPGIKIPYQMTLKVPYGQIAVTNTPVATEHSKKGIKTYEFKTTKPMPSYLLAIAAGPLESVPIEGMPIPTRIYTTKGQSHLTQLAQDITPPILAALEKYFESSYPYEKLDFIAVPEFIPGGMENAGAITFADGLFLIDPELASISQKRRLAVVIAHELAHMWFGDLVTMQWWDDLWLNEAFAEWLGEKITDEVYPEFEAELRALSRIQGAMAQDAAPTARAVRQPVHATNEIFEGLALIYQKGHGVLGMVEQWMGPEEFRQGVVQYIEANRWGNAVADDLFNSLAAQAPDKDIKGVLSDFLTQPGLPLIDLTVGEAGTITMTQRRFHNHGVEVDPQTWRLPLIVKYYDGQEIVNHPIMMDAETVTIETGRDIQWAIPNGEAHGYYRWKSPSRMMVEMAENPVGTMTPRERAVYLPNVRGLLKSGDLGGGDYLSILSSFAREAQPEIVSTVVTELGNTKGAFITEDLEEAFSVYVSESLTPAMDHFGLEKKPGEDPAVSLLRPRLLSMLAYDGAAPELRTHCRNLVEMYLADPTSVDPALLGVALSIAALDGTPAEFQRNKKRFLESEMPAERSRFLSSLGNFRDEALQDQLLEFVLGGQVRPTEVFTAVGGMFSTPAGQAKMYDWMKTNYDRIADFLPTAYLAYMPYFVTGCSPEMLTDAQLFFGQEEHSVPGTAGQLAKVSGTVTDCINLREREGRAVAEYLNSLLVEGGTTYR